MAQDLYQIPNYFELDNSLKEEHLLIRNVVHEWTKSTVLQIIEEFFMPETSSKWSFRASSMEELIFGNVKISKDNILPNKDGLGATFGCLDITGISAFK